MNHIRLGSTFLHATTETPIDVAHRGKLFRISANSPGNNVVVTLDGETAGYITAYTDHQCGAVTAALNGRVLPKTCDTLEEALDVISPT